MAKIATLILSKKCTTVIIHHVCFYIKTDYVKCVKSCLQLFNLVSNKYFNFLHICF